ncbi:uncharacterized protein LOC116203793 [Punica granatum]|uniref:Uncharacterized protein LOC116203793 n=1 Tax=Punica granatum TaxID=22663 RepID=A0A6P8D392_PUNGR|nr:uncharacterized protein LOC116203793 [Punica granatum]
MDRSVWSPPQNEYPPGSFQILVLCPAKSLGPTWGFISCSRIDESGSNMTDAYSRCSLSQHLSFQEDALQLHSTCSSMCILKIKHKETRTNTIIMGSLGCGTQAKHSDCEKHHRDYFGANFSKAMPG